MGNDRLLDYEDCENDSDSGSYYSGSAKQSVMSLSSFSLKSLQSKVARRASLDTNFISRRVSLNNSFNNSFNSSFNNSFNNSFNSLQERLASRNYGKMDEDHFDLSLMLEDSTNDLANFDCCQGSSFRTLPTVVDSSSDEDESSLDDEEPVNNSALCHLPSEMEGLVRVMINMDDPTCATLWVKSPNSARQHLELNITHKTPKASQRRKPRRAAFRPPVRSLVVPF
jgi:hypothetical protein